MPTIDSATARATTVADRPPARPRRRGRRALVTAVAVLLAAELGARAIADDLPDPEDWGTPEAQYKVDQIATLRAHGGIDVLFTGSSVLDAGADPERFDALTRTRRGSYNGSLGAGSARMIETFVTAAVLPPLRPRVVVVGLSSRDLNPNDPQQRSLESDWFDSPAVEEAFGSETALERFDRWAGDLSALVRHRAELRSPRNLLGDGTPTWDAIRTQPDGQFTQFLAARYRRTERLLDFIRGGALHDWTPGTAQLGAFRRLIEAAKRTGARVLLVDMPTTADYVELHPSGDRDMARHHAAVAQLGLLTGTPVLAPGTWDDRLFADALHLNRAGADRLTALLADELADRFPGAVRLRAR